jgi:purine-cytosine permease-like protein
MLTFGSLSREIVGQWICSDTLVIVASRGSDYCLWNCLWIAVVFLSCFFGLEWWQLGKYSGQDAVSIASEQTWSLP